MDSNEKVRQEQAVVPNQASLGLATCTALVIGNMIGSGFFIAPSALAPYGAMAIIGWGVMAVGAVCLGLVFARLARLVPATGGPYAYTRMGFGRFAGFFVAWGYWISIWSALPAMAAALVGYLAKLFPGAMGPVVAPAIGVVAIWLVASINIHGVKSAGLFQAITTYTKLVPFVAIGVFGLFWVDWSSFTTVNPSGRPFMSSLAAISPIIMFAFLGVESATVPAGDVIDPHRTIPRATILGTLITAAVYILCTTVVLGVMPLDQLAASGAPFSDAAEIIWGKWAGTIIALAAIISSLGALSGWTLLMGQVPMAAARDGLMPDMFGELSSSGSPYKGLLISASLATGLLLMEASGTGALIAFYNFIVNLSTDAAMIPYIFCCCVEAILVSRRDEVAATFRVGPFTPVALVALVFSLATIYGAGAVAGMWALILILLAAPVWVFVVCPKQKSPDDAAVPVAAEEALGNTGSGTGKSKGDRAVVTGAVTGSHNQGV